MEETIRATVEIPQKYEIWYVHPQGTYCENPAKPKRSTTLTGLRSRVLELAGINSPTCSSCGIALRADLRVK